MRPVCRLTIGNQRGSVLLASIMLVAVMTLLGVALYDLAAIEGALSTGDKVSNQLLYCAEAALSRVMIDNPGRMAQIKTLLETAPGTSLTWNDTVTIAPAGWSCANTVTFTDDTASIPARRLLRATSTAADGTQRSVRIQMNYLPPYFQYAAVANNGDFMISGAGAVPLSGPGGADLINGDIFINGRVFIGRPTISCVDGVCSSDTPAVNPRDVTDTTATVSVKTGISWTQAQADNSTAWPSPGDPNPFGSRPDMPAPDVVAYVNGLQAALGMSSSNPNGNMTGTYLGNPVLNLAAIFATLGTSSSGCVGGSTGCLRRPSGCSCGSGATGNCAIYCQLVPLNPKKNPGDRSEENANTLGDDYYLDGVDPGSDPIPDNTSTDGQRGAQRLLDFTAVSSQPPVIFVNGNARVGRNDMYGFAVNGRGTIVSNADVILSDNVMYKERLAPSGGCPANPNAAACRPATADMLGIVAKNDLWFGDPRFGTFYEGDAIMLAGRDFNFVFLDNDGNPRPPENFMTVNGTMLANRQIAIFRDFADNRSGTSDWNNVCDASSTHCQPVRYNPDISCGSPTTPGCWQFLRRDPATGLITVDGTKPAFKECVTSSCTSGRRISHFEMTVNYDNRLFTNPLLDPPAMPPGLGIIFANQWLNWQECPIPDPTGRCS